MGPPGRPKKEAIEPSTTRALPSLTGFLSRWKKANFAAVVSRVERQLTAPAGVLRTRSL